DVGPAHVAWDFGAPFGHLKLFIEVELSRRARAVTAHGLELLAQGVGGQLAAIVRCKQRFSARKVAVHQSRRELDGNLSIRCHPRLLEPLAAWQLPSFYHSGGVGSIACRVFTGSSRS